jgi:hypothetical protein
MWDALGPERVRTYMRDLLVRAVQLLADRWGTDLFAPLDLCGAMALVRLPAGLGQAELPTSADAKDVQVRALPATPLPACVQALSSIIAHNT